MENESQFSHLSEKLLLNTARVPSDSVVFISTHGYFSVKESFVEILFNCTFHWYATSYVLILVNLMQFKSIFL